MAEEINRLINGLAEFTRQLENALDSWTETNWTGIAIELH